MTSGQMPGNFSVFFWGDLSSNEPNWCEPNQSTYRQHLPKVCVQQFHGQDEDRLRIFSALFGSFWVGDNV